jgi:transcriptional regulator with XRE-family HTH domain
LLAVNYVSNRYTPQVPNGDFFVKEILIDPLEVGARIKLLRGDSTQTEFADFVGASRVSVARYEAGARTPDAEFLLRLHVRFGIDMAWVLTGVESDERISAPRLSAEEEVLLDRWRSASKPVRNAALGALIGAAGPKVQQNFHAAIDGQVISGEQMTNVYQSTKPARTR